MRLSVRSPHSLMVFACNLLKIRRAFDVTSDITSLTTVKCGATIHVSGHKKARPCARACLQSSSDAAFRKSRIEEWRGSMVSLQTRPNDKSLFTPHSSLLTNKG